MGGNVANQQPGNTMGDGQINRNQPYNNQPPANPLSSLIGNAPSQPVVGNTPNFGHQFGGQTNQYSPFGNEYHGMNHFNNGFGGFNPNGQQPQGGPMPLSIPNNQILGGAAQPNLQQSNPQLFASLQSLAQNTSGQLPQNNAMQSNPLFGATQQPNLQQSNPQLYAALQGFAQKPLNNMNNLPGTTPPTMQFQQQGPIGFDSQNQQSGLGAIGSSMPNKLA
jgi:hypothetical protein